MLKAGKWLKFPTPLIWGRAQG